MVYVKKTRRRKNSAYRKRVRRTQRGGLFGLSKKNNPEDPNSAKSEDEKSCIRKCAEESLRRKKESIKRSASAVKASFGNAASAVKGKVGDAASAVKGKVGDAASAVGTAASDSAKYLGKQAKKGSLKVQGAALQGMAGVLAAPSAVNEGYKKVKQSISNIDLQKASENLREKADSKYEQASTMGGNRRRRTKRNTRRRTKKNTRKTNRRVRRR